MLSVNSTNRHSTPVEHFGGAKAFELQQDETLES
jgi:hypothetical protein